MAIFEGAPPVTQTTALSGTAISQVFNITNGAVVNGATVPSTFASAHDMIVVNSGPNTIYLGQAAVSTTTGLPVAAGQQVTIQGPVQALYALAGTGNSATVLAGLASLVVSE